VLERVRLAAKLNPHETKTRGVPSPIVPHGLAYEIVQKWEFRSSDSRDQRIAGAIAFVAGALVSMLDRTYWMTFSVEVGLSYKDPARWASVSTYQLVISMSGPAEVPQATFPFM
jgi:hypothetical protein